MLMYQEWMESVPLDVEIRSNNNSAVNEIK